MGRYRNPPPDVADTDEEVEGFHDDIDKFDEGYTGDHD